MVKAELSYNPYLLETNIKFNGHPPRINSLVEKYQDGSLHSWISMVPSIFHDEMNGYDFELDFTGTKRDFSELCDAFSCAGVSNEQVRLFHKNELDERKTKTAAIDALLRWLSKHRNRRFDYEKFSKVHQELFEGAYPLIVIQGPDVEQHLDGLELAVEYIDAVDELLHTNLTNTVILLYAKQANLPAFQANLKELLLRNDVIQEQLFFMLHPSLDEEKMNRMIQDLGILSPQIIASISDESVRSYMELYPISDYIREVITTMRQETSALQSLLNAENQRSAIANRSVYNRINNLEDIIRGIKASLEQFTERSNLDIPMDWQQTRNELEDSIRYWRSRKTKITNEQEATLVARDFDIDLDRLFAEYVSSMEAHADIKAKKLAEKFERWYQTSGFTTPPSVYEVSLKNPEIPETPTMVKQLLNLKQVRNVQPRDAILGRFFQIPNAEETFQETTYYYQEWRDCMLDAAMPLADELLNGWHDQICAYEKELAQVYMEHLKQLAEQKTNEKNQVSAQLSDEEQKLRDDNDWLSEFCDQLHVIERG